LGAITLREWAFLLLLIGFAIKLPAVPLHTWLPDAHVEASTPVSVLLAALLLKFGGYGLLRFAIPLFPSEATSFSFLIGLMGIVSIIYGGMNALASKDIKALIAYSSISHMGFVLLGISSYTVEGINGAIYQMVSHGILSAMLFLIAGVIYERTNDRTIENYSGLFKSMPAFGGFVLVAFFASLGLPGFSGFIGEFLALLGAFKSSHLNHLLPSWIPLVAIGGLLLAAGYFLWTLQRMFYGPFYNKSDQPLPDLNQREYLMLTPLAIATLVLGLFPQLLINWIGPYSEHLIRLVFKS